MSQFLRRLGRIADITTYAWLTLGFSRVLFGLGHVWPRILFSDVSSTTIDLAGASGRYLGWGDHESVSMSAVMNDSAVESGSLIPDRFEGFGVGTITRNHQLGSKFGLISK
jgi:hypothetical protein